ncbi:hypothetical protein Bca4012_018413 [Brassica carinata]
MEDYERNSKSPAHGEISYVRKGPWTEDEDAILVSFVSIHGHARWNHIACSSGLKRTGKSCRLRWVNYLCPDVKRGNITLEEQFTILKLHSLWGNSDLFKETMRNVWMPRLMEKINSQSTPATCELLESMITDPRQPIDTQNPVEPGCNQFNPIQYHQQFVPASELAPTSSNTPVETLSDVQGRVVNGPGYDHVVQRGFEEFSDWDCVGGDTMWTDDDESFWFLLDQFCPGTTSNNNQGNNNDYDI